MGRVRDLEIRWKLLAVVLPLVVVPVAVVGSVVGYQANRQAVAGINRTSEGDLEHMAQFAVDLLNAHYRQFQVYREDKDATLRQDLAALVDIAYGLVEAQHRRFAAGERGLVEARQDAHGALRGADLGESGYLFAMTSLGDLVVHPAREGENVYDATDEGGRAFIREMCEAAVAAPAGEVGYTIYPWRNRILGDPVPRRKLVAYRYFAPWDWVVAAGTYLDQGRDDSAFERAAFDKLKAAIKAKRVGRTGYIFAMTSAGELTIHPSREGESVYDEWDDDGRPFIREMCVTRSGWIRYPWKNQGELLPRMKIVRYEYFPPWDWIVAVGSYEDEFLGEARAISGRIFFSMLGLTVGVALVAALLVVWASKVLTDPIRALGEGIRRVQGGGLGQRIGLRRGDELGELSDGFDRMAEVLQQHKTLDQEITQQGRAVSLGVLASGVAHEINNPLGVILGFAGYLEQKLPEGDPNRPPVAGIKRESQHCRSIVQDLLRYARLPTPRLGDCDLDALLDHTLAYVSQQAPLQGVEIRRQTAAGLPTLPADREQLRQVLLHLLQNAGEALEGAGTITVTTRRDVDWAEVGIADTGPGMSPDDLESVFEPFHTGKPGGTGLGLAICRQIVERHHGEILLYSAPGEGTRVVLRLPLVHEEF